MTSIKQRSISHVKLGVALVAAVPSCGPALATETALPLTPAGGADVSQAILPPPGFYAAAAALPVNENKSLTDRFGNDVPDENTPFFSIPIEAVGLTYVYPFKIAGGSVASSLQLPYYSLKFSLGGATFKQQGIGDLYADIFQWSRPLGRLKPAPANPALQYGAAVSAGFALKAPTGRYSASNPVNIGSNVWVFVPNVALTYTAKPLFGIGDSTEVSGKVFYGMPTRNGATNYQSGDTIAVDFAASQGAGRLRAGVAGSYGIQVSDDILAGGIRPPGGNRSKVLQIGPVVQYALPKLGGVVKAKYIRGVYARNAINQEYLVLVLAFKL